MVVASLVAPGTTDVADVVAGFAAGPPAGTAARATLRVRGARRILLVTDSLHLVRARPLFEQAGLQVLPAPTDDRLAEVSTPSARVALALHLLQEGLARLYYRVAGYST